jgi:hypothetical protein
MNSTMNEIGSTPGSSIATTASTTIEIRQWRRISAELMICSRARISITTGISNTIPIASSVSSTNWM